MNISVVWIQEDCITDTHCLHRDGSSYDCLNFILPTDALKKKILYKLALADCILEGKPRKKCDLIAACVRLGDHPEDCKRWLRHGGK